MFEDQRDDEDGDAQLAALLRAEREAARVFLAQADALLDVWDSSPPGTRAGAHAHALAEAGLVLGLHPQTVDHRLSRAVGLRDHPLLRSLLQSGRLGVPHALTALDEVLPLGDGPLADQVLQAVLTSGGRLGWDGTPGQLRLALRRAAVRLDPDGAARRRAEQQAARTQVRLRARDDGLADWTATGPAPSLLAADRLLDVLSAPSGPADTRSRGQRQLDALVGALLHRAGTAVPLELQLDVPVDLTAVELYRDVPVPEPLRLEADLTPQLLQLLTAQVPAQLRETPASEVTWEHESAVEPSVTGAVGSVPGQREDREDRPAGVGDHSRPADAAVRADALASSHDDQPDDDQSDDQSDDPTDEDADARPRRARRRSGVPELQGHGPVDPGLLADLLTDPRGLPPGLGPVTVRRACVDRSGQVVAVDDRARPLHRLVGQGASRERLLQRLVERLPQPPPATSAHDPTAAQTRVLRARDPHCTFPGCPRPASRSEADHRLRFPDGPTALCNLHPLCKHHHRLKHDGFSPRREPGGATTWSTPRGRTATTRPP